VDSSGAVSVVSFRYDMAPGTQSIYFTPTALAADRLSDTGPAALKHLEAGALFTMLSQLGALPARYAKLVWEVQLDSTPPPTAQVLKPKLWVLRTLALQPGLAYRLK
jgi:hypothetical protein